MLKLFLQGVLDLLWPPRTTCLLCEGWPVREGPQGSQAPPGADRLPVCFACWDAMLFAPGVTRCTNCNRPLGGGWGHLCTECAAGPAFGQVWALGLHRGPLREAIHHLKFNGRQALGVPLGTWLAGQIPPAHELIVPMPLHPSRLRDRGYNQASLIAQGLASTLRIPVVDGVLQRLRSTRHQAKLDREERLHNLQGAFGTRAQAAPPWFGRAVLLVDDVLTTGATASAAASVLRQTGARRVDLAVLAVSEKRVDAAGSA